MGLLPLRLKYAAGGAVRRRKAPYSFIGQGDTVVQIGAARDVLAAGRSRAVHFARLIGTGRVVVVEPDPDNCAAVRRTVRRLGLRQRVIVVESGAWNGPGEIEFLLSPDHPAANVPAELPNVAETLKSGKSFRRVRVPVDSLDRILAELELPIPKLVSITTNGAETEILRGASETLSRGVNFVSLAATGPDYPALMKTLGYGLIAKDDRGFTFKQKSAQPT